MSESLLDKIKKLEKISLKLEPVHKLRKQITFQTIQFAENFLEHLPTAALKQIKELINYSKVKFNPSEEGKSITDLLSQVDKYIVNTGLNPASGGYLGYIPGGGIYPSALGDYLAAVTNRFAGVHFASPFAVKMEHDLIQWMAQSIGYPKTALGNLTSGGSVANLIAITTAREAYSIKAKNFEKSCIYFTSQTHHSIEKAFKIAGMTESKMRIIPTDKNFRMDCNLLEKQIKKDKQKGLNPWLVIANAGTTDTGAVDPLKEISDIAKQYRLWMHVDAAYGGFFILCKEGIKILKDMKLSDSIVMDPHKSLFLPYGTGTVIVKNGSWLYESHKYQANYMHDLSSPSHSPAELGPELTKHFRGLRLWLPLQLFGVSPFRAALEEKILLTRYFYQEIIKIKNIEVGQFPDLSIVIFRYKPDKKADCNSLNQKLIEFIQKDNRVFLSSTLINSQMYLRMACMSFRTHLEHINITLEIIREFVSKY